MTSNRARRSLTLVTAGTSFPAMTTNPPSDGRRPAWPPTERPGPEPFPAVDATGLPDPRQTPTVNLEHARTFLGIGRSKAYRNAHAGELAPGVPVIRVGSRFRVSTAVLRRALGIDLPADATPPAMRRAAGDG
jgi:hypothetical protein